MLMPKPKKVKDVDDFARSMGDNESALTAILQHLKPLEKSDFAPAVTSLQQSFPDTAVQVNSSTAVQVNTSSPNPLSRLERPEGEVPWNDIEGAIEATALSKPKSSDNLIREFGRWLRGIEEVLRMKFSAKTLQQIYLRWETRNKNYLTAGRDYFPEFLRKYGTVRVPYGATLRVALEAARLATPPSAATVLRDPDAHVLGSVCRELARMAGNRPFVLKHAAVAAEMRRPRRTITDWLAALEALGVIDRAYRGHRGANGKRGKASEYYYLAD